MALRRRITAILEWSIFCIGAVKSMRIFCAETWFVRWLSLPLVEPPVSGPPASCGSARDSKSVGITDGLWRTN